MKYLFLVSEASSKSQMDLWRDLREIPDCTFISPWGSDNIATKCFRNMIRMMEKVFHINIIKNINTKRSLITDETDTFVIIEPGYLMTAYPEKVYEKLRKNKNIKLCLLLIDSMQAASPSLMSMKEFILSHSWDKVLSFSKIDCNTYGWQHLPTMYSALPSKKSRSIKHDAYFIGGLKGNRESTILSLFRFLTDNGVNCCFDLWCHSHEQFNNAIYKNEINYRLHFLKYRKVLSKVQSSNCIIEIVQEGHNSKSLRWFEAVYLNKKLLTNNPYVIELPFYNPRYMKFFQSIDEIDFKWVSSRENVDYGYDGQLSMKKLLEYI